MTDDFTIRQWLCYACGWWNTESMEQCRNLEGHGVETPERSDDE